SPVLLRVGDELIALDADGTRLVDIDGRSRPVIGDRQVFAVDAEADVSGRPAAGTGPYRLESAHRDLLAISPGAEGFSRGSEPCRATIRVSAWPRTWRHRPAPRCGRPVRHPRGRR